MIFYLHHIDAIGLVSQINLVRKCRSSDEEKGRVKMEGEENLLYDVS